MDGLKPGRIVYLVLSALMAEEIMRRRTTGANIAQRIRSNDWPIGAQAHIGSDVHAGDVVPAIVTRVPTAGLAINVKAMLDGSDTYWAQQVEFDESKLHGTWHWMFDGQQKRYDATVPH